GPKAPIECSRRDTGNRGVTEDGVQHTNVDRCATARGELRYRGQLWNQDGFRLGGERQAGGYRNPARQHRLKHRIPVASAEALFCSSLRASGSPRGPDPLSTILMSHPATSQSECPPQLFSGRLTLRGSVPRIAGLCRAAPITCRPETATYEYR